MALYWAKARLITFVEKRHVPVFNVFWHHLLFNFVFKEASREQIKYLLLDNEHETVDGAEVERLLDEQDHGRLKSR